MRKKLRIAVFHLAFVYSGGGEKLVIEEVKGLRQKGHQVDCFVPIIDRQACFPDLLEGAEVKEIIPGLSRLRMMQPALAVFMTCVLMPFIARRFVRYDVLLGANQPGPWFCYLIHRLYKTPYLIYLAQPTRILYPRLIDREVGLRLKKKLRFLPVLVNIFRPFIWWADRVSIYKAGAMLVNGSYISGVLEKIYGRRGINCPAGSWPLTEKKLGLRSGFRGEVLVNQSRIAKPYILLTNRHFPQKKFEWALEVMSRVWRRFPEVKLAITGQETDYTQSLKKLVARKGWEKNVLFLGLVTEKELQRLYRGAAVYIYSSPEEDFGMGIVEAMAAGVPVVAWENAGPTGIVVHGKTGFLAKPFVMGDFGRKIVRLLEDEKLSGRMGRAGWRRAKKMFSYSGHVSKIETAFLKEERR